MLVCLVLIRVNASHEVHFLTIPGTDLFLRLNVIHCSVRIPEELLSLILELLNFNRIIVILILLTRFDMLFDLEFIKLLLQLIDASLGRLLIILGLSLLESLLLSLSLSLSLGLSELLSFLGSLLLSS